MENRLSTISMRSGFGGKLIWEESKLNLHVLKTVAPSESPESVTMSLIEELRARMERMKKVAQEKKKWKDKATQGGGGGTGGTASGRQAPFVSGGSAPFKVFFTLIMNYFQIFNISFFFSGDYSSQLTDLKKQV